MKKGPGRLGRSVLAVPTAALLCACAGCGDQGGLESAGPTPTAVGPERLWPTLPPATRAADDYGAEETAVVKGVEVPGGKLRDVDPVTIVRARVAAAPDDYKDIAADVADCPASKDCPVLGGYYRDLTGDGRDDLLVAVRAPHRQAYLQTYTYSGGKLTQIMDDKDAVLKVHLAGRNIVVRAAADLSGYEYRTSWSYDGHQKAMLPTRDEILRTGSSHTPDAPSPSRS
ncbi:hypothetical protein [Streptomyces endophyticus]|uniref:Lipoprotein n=1 Tax=Streptomyces endophyticus TaxID=714166 RepID=A0ABU6F4U5_9ACTN|nr:hypothetical protein [Streptomyces endophyticus]MEB8338702.1 hypothetical protein [Streptomyces endophyticus]